MTQRKLKFALFGNIYQAKKSAAIQKVLSCLSEDGAELAVDQEYYDFLKNDQRIASAKALEEQLTNSIDALQETVAEAKKNGGFMNRLRGMLDKIVNGEDE